MAQVVAVAGLVEAGFLQGTGKGLGVGEGGFQFGDAGGYLVVRYGQAATAGFLPEQLLVDQLLQGFALQALVGHRTADGAHLAALDLQVIGEVPLQPEIADVGAVDPRGSTGFAGQHQGCDQADHQPQPWIGFHPVVLLKAWYPP
ncbi:hypothetical protein D3C76_1211060 [compost metagenome]